VLPSGPARPAGHARYQPSAGRPPRKSRSTSPSHARRALGFVVRAREQRQRIRRVPVTFETVRRRQNGAGTAMVRTNFIAVGRATAVSQPI